MDEWRKSASQPGRMLEDEAELGNNDVEKFNPFSENESDRD